MGNKEYILIEEQTVVLLTSEGYNANMINAQSRHMMCSYLNTYEYGTWFKHRLL